MLEIGAIILGTATIITQVITLKELVCMERYLKAKRKQGRRKEDSSSEDDRGRRGQTGKC